MIAEQTTEETLAELKRRFEHEVRAARLLPRMLTSDCGVLGSLPEWGNVTVLTGAVTENGNITVMVYADNNRDVYFNCELPYEHAAAPADTVYA